MSLTLRHYQEEGVEAVYEYFRHETGNPILAYPTGTGKSLWIAEFIKRVFASYPWSRVIMATHVKELIRQNLEEFVEHWPMAPVAVYSAGLGIKQVAPIIFGGIASMAKKFELFGHIDLIIIDECHLLSPHDDTLYRLFIAGLKSINPKLKVIGLTATPYRLGQGLLTESVATPKGEIKPPLFTHICCNWTSMEKFNRLIAENFLCTLIPKRTKEEIDLEGIRLVAGEFNLDQLQDAVDREEITRRAIDEVLATATVELHETGSFRLRWLMFACGITHSDHIAAELQNRGIEARSIHSKTPDELRDQWIREFKQPPTDGVVRCLVNNNVLTTGFNAPAVDLIGMFRATNSPGLWVQMLGRGTRVYPGKSNCLVLDFAGNTKRLGPINDPVIPKRRGKHEGGEAPVKICEHCGTYNHASVRFCISCGAEFTKAVKFSDQAAREELVRNASPQVEIFDIDRVEVRRHNSRHEHKPDSLKVSYWSGIRMFSEWVCLEHEGFAGKKARDWWRARSENPDAAPPETIGEALDLFNDLAVPTHMRIWVNKTRPEILAFDFSGTAFQTRSPRLKSSGKPDVSALDDEDVPF